MSKCRIDFSDVQILDVGTFAYSALAKSRSCNI